MPTRIRNTNGATAASAATALPANSDGRRVGWGIQNSGTNVLGVVIGNTTIDLKACTVNDDGTGGGHVDMGPTCWDGIVTVTGSSRRYNVFEYLQ
jgi:hypothetical protein